MNLLGRAKTDVFMRVLCIVYAILNHDNRVTKLCRVLSDNGYHVDVFALKGSTTGGLNVHLKCSSIAKYRGASRLYYFLSYLGFFFESSVFAVCSMLRKKYAVVHVHNMPDFLVFAGVIPRMMGARLILDVHDSTRDVFSSKFNGPVFDWLLALEEYVCYSVPHVLFTVHNVYRERLHKVTGRSPDQISAVLNLPDFSDAVTVNRAADETFLIVHHGAITHRHGTDLLVKAFNRAVSSMPNARLSIFGSGDAARDVTAEINQGDKECVSFPQSTFDYRDIPSMLEGAACGVVPVRPDRYVDNILPVKMLEYLSLGIPTMVTDIPSLDQGLRAYVICLDRKRITETVAEELTRLYSDRGYYDTWKEKALAFRETFNWETEARKILFAYRHLLNS